MEKKYKIQQVGCDVKLSLPTDEPEVMKIPVYRSKTDGTMYPISQVKTIEYLQDSELYVLNWDGATAKLTKSAFENQIRPYIEIVNK